MNNYIILVFGGAFLLAALYLLWKQVTIRKIGIRTTGVVVAIKAADNDEINRSYRPIVQFTTTHGQQILWKSSDTIRSWRNIVGKPWPIIYDPRKPQRAIADNRKQFVTITAFFAIFIGSLVLFIHAMRL